MATRPGGVTSLAWASITSKSLSSHGAVVSRWGWKLQLVVSKVNVGRGAGYVRLCALERLLRSRFRKGQGGWAPED